MYVSKQKPDKDRCIRSIRDGLGFCAESQIIFGTVWQRPAKGCIQTVKSGMVGMANAVEVVFIPVYFSLGSILYSVEEFGKNVK